MTRNYWSLQLPLSRSNMATVFGLKALICFTFFVSSFVFIQVSGRCKQYYFGLADDHCYRCHCKPTFPCDSLRGQCSEAKCANNFTGSSCQYVALAYSSPDPRYERIVDGFPKTCNQSLGRAHFPMEFNISDKRSLTDVITLALKTPMAVSGRAASLRDISIVYYDSANASARLRPHLAQPNDTLISYHLPRPARVIRVEIHVDADVDLDLCELSVLGGRNLAIGKNATQGPETYNADDMYAAGNAVDGRTSSGALFTHTTYGTSWWKVFLGNNLAIWKLRVYNRRGDVGSRLRGFVVNVTLNNSTELEVYRHDHNKSLWLTTEVCLDRPLAATHVKVWLDKQEFLSLSEVEVIGDCQDGYYGWECDKKCQCANSSEICDKIWGYCTHTGCAPGFKGDNCSEKCLAGTYGVKCAGNCSSCVNNSCDHLTGNCFNGCRPGWQGSQCHQKCPRGSYGDHCNNHCPSGCRDGLCDHVTGVCSGCAAGRLGVLCNETCSPGFHGYNCTQSCSNICMENSCNAATGHCSMGCKQGMTGVLCDEMHASEEKDGVSWLIIGSVIGAVLFLLLALVITPVIIYRSRPRRQQKQTDKSDNTHGMLMDQLDSPNSGGTDPRARQDDNRHVYPLPIKGGDRKRAPEPEVDKPLSDVRPPALADSATKPTPKPRTAKPELMTLFSRDASLDPPPTDPDPAPRNLAFTETAPRTVSREGLMLFSGQPQSPKTPRTTPTLIRKGASFESLDTLSVDGIDEANHGPKDLCNVAVTPSSPSQARRAREDYYNVVHRDTSPTTTIPLAELTARVAKWLENPRFFSKQKEMLPAGKMADWKIALIPENLKKSRYRDIFPYDHSRVQLALLPDDPHSDFYNACYIDGYEKEREYIAAQGPMERTLYDFLRLVWDMKSSRIVMLTNTVELGRFKCQQYWPEEEMTSRDITVRLDSVITFADYCIRLLTFQRGGESRSVTMYHYTAWPDNFAPASPWSLLDFRQHVRQGACDDAPVIVHCSAGIGRTGTFLALDILLTRADHCSDVDVFACVWKLRQQRIHMVQTLAQYIFIHETLSASLLTSPPIPVEVFINTGPPDVKTEFAKLQRCLGPEKHDRDDSTPPDVVGLPSDLHRVHIVSVPGGPSPAYINAVYMSNYSHHQAYIQTHSPLDEEGAICFLAMLVQHRVTCIICLDVDQSATYRFYPEVGERAVQVGPYLVVLDSVNKAPERLVSTLRVRYPLEDSEEQEGEDGATEGWHDVTHIKCTAWPQSRLTPTPSVILNLLEVTKPETTGTSVVYCNDGFSKSGLFCTAAAVMERLHVEDRVAVNYVTAHMRIPRRENIVTEDQYRFLYECVLHRVGKDVVAGRLQGPSVTGENLYGNIGDLSGGAGDAAPPAAGERDSYEVMKIRASAGHSIEAAGSDGGHASARSANKGYFDMNRLPSAAPSQTPVQASLAAASENTYGNTQTTSTADQGGQPTTEENIYGNTIDASTATQSAQRVAGKVAPKNVDDSSTAENVYGNIVDVSARSNSAGKGTGRGAAARVEDPSTVENIYGNTMAMSATTNSGTDTNRTECGSTKQHSPEENVYGNISSY